MSNDFRNILTPYKKKSCLDCIEISRILSENHKFYGTITAKIDKFQSSVNCSNIIKIASDFVCMLVLPISVMCKNFQVI